MPNAHDNGTLFEHRKEVRSLRKLKINFFSLREDFLAEAFRLEQMLSHLGRVDSSRGGGIAQFTLRTELDIERVREEIAELSLGGQTTVREEEDEEMEAV